MTREAFGRAEAVKIRDAEEQCTKVQCTHSEESPQQLDVCKSNRLDEPALCREMPGREENNSVHLESL